MRIMESDKPMDGFVDVKNWVVRTASVTKPYNKDWSVSVTLGMDINEYGSTIEIAYRKLTDRIINSEYLYNQFKQNK
jgi:hypothetical protein